jgi:hypothetical protein
MRQRLSQLGTYFDQEASEGRLGVRSNAILFRRDIHVRSITIFCRRDIHGHKVPSNFRRKFLKSFGGGGGHLEGEGYKLWTSNLCHLVFLSLTTPYSTIIPWDLHFPLVNISQGLDTKYGSWGSIFHPIQFKVWSHEQCPLCTFPPKTSYTLFTILMCSVLLVEHIEIWRLPYSKNKFIFWKIIIIHFVNVETELTLGYSSVESVKRNCQNLPFPEVACIICWTQYNSDKE